MPLVRLAWNRALINRRYKLTSRTRAWKHHPVKQRQGIGKYLYRDILFSAKYCYIRKARNSIESWNSYVIRKGDIETSEIIHLVTNAQIHISLSHIDSTKLCAENLSLQNCNAVFARRNYFTRMSSRVCRHIYYVAPLIDIHAMCLENTSSICTVFATGFSIYCYSGNYPRSMKRLSLSKSRTCEYIHANSTLLA